MSTLVNNLPLELIGVNSTMIMIHMDSNQNVGTYSEKLEKMIDHTEAYNFGEVLVITEKDPRIIRDMITLYEPYQFIIYSLKEFQKLSPTMISELILYMVDKLDITFTVYEDDLYFDKENILTIYPKIFEYYKRES